MSKESKVHDAWLHERRRAARLEKIKIQQTN
jgi:hypothetical protein